MRVLGALVHARKALPKLWQLHFLHSEENAHEVSAMRAAVRDGSMRVISLDAAFPKVAKLWNA